LESVKSEEPKVKDPSVEIEPDLRLTMKEWVLYWKVRYENSFERIAKAAQFIDAMREEMKKLKTENARLVEQCNAMQAQYNAEVKARQTQQTEGRPEVDWTPPRAKAFKRKKKS
jgi:hypothetical protein